VIPSPNQEITAAKHRKVLKSALRVADTSGDGVLDAGELKARGGQPLPRAASFCAAVPCAVRAITVLIAAYSVL
jgi:hypothetical protein